MRRYNKKNNFKIILIIALSVIILAAVAVGVYFITSSNTPNAPGNALSDAIIVEDGTDSSVVVHFVNNNDYSLLGINDEINSQIKEYFTRYFAALGDFSDTAFDDLFLATSADEAEVSNRMVDYQNEIRSNSAIDMSYDDVTCGVTYKDYKNNGGYLEITLTQNDYTNYKFANGITSYTSDVEHTFMFTKQGKEYIIASHSEISSVYDLMREVITNNTDSNSRESAFKRIVSETKSKMTSLNSFRDEYNKSPGAFPITVVADNPYNAAAALDYSYRYVGKYEIVRNPEYEMYDNVGGNCCNYVSQCLLNGGIPFDVTDYVWKWYGKNKQDNTEREGYSSSWISSESFYQYCLNNKVGMVTDMPRNPFCGRVGDVIQYVNNSETKHTAIITKVITDEKGNVLDYLINCNTTDKVDCPMSIYGYTDFRLIRIIGYNN